MQCGNAWIFLYLNLFCSEKRFLRIWVDRKWPVVLLCMSENVDSIFFLKWQNLPVCYCCQMLCILVQEAPSVAWTGLEAQEEAELSHLPQQGTATDLTSRILNKNFNLVAEQELFTFRFIKETCGVWLHSKLTYSSLFVLFLDRFYKHCTLAREI